MLLRWAVWRPTFSSQLRRGLASVPHTHPNLSPGTPLSAAAADEVKIPFTSLKGVIHDRTLMALIKKPFNLENMTSVQAAVLPLLPALAHPALPNSSAPRDLLVKAKTGTGKTLGFLIPVLEARLNKLKSVAQQAENESGDTTEGFRSRSDRSFAKKHVGTVIISPTRELASQIAVEAARLASFHEGFEVHLFVGGVSKGAQMRQWFRGRRDLVVATPGRLRDLLENEPDFVNAFSQVQVLVLDEADTLLDMGFRDDIEAIAKFLPSKTERQTFLFSATVSKAIHQIARSVMNNNHSFINTVSENASPVHAHVPQYFTVVPKSADQLPHLLRLISHDQLTNYGRSKVIIFLPTTKMTQLYGTMIRSLKGDAFPAGRSTEIYEIHSKKAQESRTNTSDAFRRDVSGACVLVTSDVSARGVDYPNVTRVIQVGVPQTVEQYIHRVGRTGRRDLAGRGDLVLLPWESSFVSLQMTEIPIKQLRHEEFSKELEGVASNIDREGLPQIERPVITRSFSRNERRPRYGEIHLPVTPILEKIENTVSDLTKQLDEEAVREVFTSLLGYYLGRVGELRCEKDVILEGCREFTTGALGLDEAPYVSQAFLTKIGFSDSSSRPRMRSSGGRNSGRSSFGLKGSLNTSSRNEGQSFFDSERRSRSSGWRDSNDNRSSMYQSRPYDSHEAPRFRLTRSDSPETSRFDRTRRSRFDRDTPRRTPESF